MRAAASIPLFSSSLAWLRLQLVVVVVVMVIMDKHTAIMAFQQQPIVTRTLSLSRSEGSSSSSGTLRQGMRVPSLLLSSSSSSTTTSLAAAQSSPTPPMSTNLSSSSSELVDYSIPRRNILLQSTSSLLLTAACPLPSSAATTSTNKPPPILPLLTTASRLHIIPTYAIVDGNGTPFHTYDKDSASGIGYFFLSYKGAEYVLEDAKKAFEKAKEVAAKAKEEAPSTITTTIAATTITGEDTDADSSTTDDVPESWGRAQIVSIPLDYALQLSIKSTKSLALNGRGKTFSTYYQIIPDTNALNAALRIDDGVRYRERGRVPLFYVDGLTIPSNYANGGSVDGGGGSSEVLHPVYFNIKDLKAEWNRQYPGEELPPINVRELNETFRSMIRPGGKDESVRDIVFVSDSESGDMARTKVVGRSYKLGEMILTK